MQLVDKHDELFDNQTRNHSARLWFAGVGRMITTDKAALEALGLNEGDAAAILGRRRQSVNAALGKGSQRDDYFSVAEMLALCLAAKGRGHKVDDSVLAGYLRKHRSEKDAQDFLTGFGAFGPPDVSEFDELWVVIPDFVRVRTETPERVEDYRAFANDNGLGRVVFLCGSPIHRDALRSFLGLPEHAGADDRVIVISDSMISAQMSMLIGNPKGKPSVFALTKAGFLSTPYVDSGLLSEFIQQRIPQLRDLRQVQRRR